MSENEPKNDEQKIPPKLVIRPQTGGAGDEHPPAEKKRETSKISLDAAVPPNDGTKTIRLKPADSGGAKVPKPGIITQTPQAKASPVSEKRKTSRISLEAALAPEAPADGDAPKTIRLKKPSEAATVRVGQSAPATKSDTTPVDKAELSKTSQIQAEEAKPVTRRRTIRVKRPTGKRSVDVGDQPADAPEAPAAEPGEAPVVAAMPAAPVETKDEPNGFFVFSAVAAVLIVCVTIYMFAAQAFGPNSSLTRLSYGAPELDLAWPGKLTGAR